MKKRYVFSILAIIFFSLLFVLVQVEKENPSASIHTFSDAFWYLIVTLSTIGYGDYYPVTSFGKIISIIFILTSFGILGYIISTLTIKINQYMEDKKTGFFGTNMKNHIVMIGYDKFSGIILKQIVATGIKVAVVTDKREDIDTISLSLKNKDVFTLYTDLEDFESLEKVNIAQSSKVFIKLDDDTKMLVYILHLKRYYKDLEIVVSLDNSTLKEPFKSAGVLYAVSREEIAAKLVASFIFEPEVALLTEDIMSSAVDKHDFDLMEFRVTTDNPFLGKEYNLVFHEMKEKYDCILLGIYQDKILFKNPSKKIILKENDYLVILSNGLGENQLTELFNTKQGHF